MITARPSSTLGTPGSPLIPVTLLAVLLGLVAAVFAPAAHATESAYRYWGFWTADANANAWSYATQGPATMGVADGDIHGWRFGIARESDASAPEPGVAPQEVWDRACADEPAASGSVRVAVILDFGIPEHAPPKETPPEMKLACAIVDDGANGAQVLTAIADIRTDTGLICAFDEYPATECAPSITVEDDSAAVQPDHGASAASDIGSDIESDDRSIDGSVTTTDSAADSAATSGGSMLTIIFGAAIVLIVFVAIALLATRRSSGRNR